MRFHRLKPVLRGSVGALKPAGIDHEFAVLQGSLDRFATPVEFRDITIGKLPKEFQQAAFSQVVKVEAKLRRRHMGWILTLGSRFQS
jgi:hypothetical protein